MKAIFHFSTPAPRTPRIGGMSSRRYAEGTIRDLKFQPHPGEYVARFTGKLICAELGQHQPAVEIHFEAESTVAHSEGVRVEYRTKRWYFFEDEFHLFAMALNGALGDVASHPHPLAMGPLSHLL